MSEYNVFGFICWVLMGAFVAVCFTIHDPTVHRLACLDAFLWAVVGAVKLYEILS